MQRLPPAEPLLEALRMPMVIVLIGTSGTGKTTLRHRLVAGGLPPDLVISLDDLHRAARADDVARGRPPQPLQSYSAVAVRRAAAKAAVLASAGVGYVADTTHLPRRERRVHVLTAEAAGLPSASVLTPLPGLDILLARNGPGLRRSGPDGRRRGPGRFDAMAAGRGRGR